MKILVPIDGSENALHAVSYVGHMMQALPKAQVTLMYVITFEPYTRSEEALRESNARREAEEALAQADSVLEALAGHKAERYIAKGFSAADQILEIAEAEHFDGIVMGSRGLSELKRFFIGSVSTRVSQHAPCTVTLVK